MTDPGDPYDLVSAATALDALADDDPASLGQLESAVRVLTDRVDEVEDRALNSVQDLTAEVNDLRDTVDELIAKDKEKQDPPQPEWWSDRADGDDWDALAGWVDTLRLSTSLDDNHVVYACWPAHRGVVEELAALHSAWKLAMITDVLAAKTGAIAGIAWFDRWLWPCLERITSARYGITNCRHAHVPEQPLSDVRPTDRGLFPPGLIRRRRAG